ncbi:MAG TPA: AraC family transcriptional regulator ligand-binding domain-containing protein [Polyangiaceae bacterium]|jgi:AraC-like DNA-binding protein|nr:AraC family transcriptional regulator ligand-binding domain-containing protein [Polyangiaceae bacterium]
MLASCSVRLLQPFIRVAASSAAHRDLVPSTFLNVKSDDRVPLKEAHEMLERGIEHFKDEGLGLKLGTAMTFGMGGAFDYAVRSAPNVRESFAVASRYSRLLTDSFRLSFEVRKRQALIRLEDESPWPRSAADFGMSALYKLHVADQVPPEHIECWFTYAEPEDLSVHASTFAGAALKFDMPFFGFACDMSHIDAPMPGSDTALHGLLRARAESILSELTSSQSLASLVRRLLQQSIPTGDTSAEGVARTLRMSRRTMTRRLEREQTTFQAELDAARRKLATEHLREGRAPLTEIAFLSGFSHVESFHRAFKRWTGVTPLAYRSGGDA